MAALLALKRFRIERGGATVLKAEALEVGTTDSASHQRIGLDGDWSALFQVLTGDLDHAGELTIAGVAPRDLLRLGHLALALCEPELPLKLSVSQLLDVRVRARFGAARAGARRALIEASLERTGLAKLARQRLSRLSALSRRCLMLALADVTNAGILLLEDPFALLDAAECETLAQVLTRMATGRHVLLSNTSAQPCALAWLSRCHARLVVRQAAIEPLVPSADQPEHRERPWRISVLRRAPQLAAELQVQGVHVSQLEPLPCELQARFPTAEDEAGGVLVAHLPPAATSSLILAAAATSDTSLIGLQSLLLPARPWPYEPDGSEPSRSR